MATALGVRRALWFATLAYTAFVIYGSLVPLHFRPLPLESAWRAFQDIRYLQLGIGSRADWVANILLFIPLAFLWLGVLCPRGGAFARAVVCGLALIGCAALSLGIEFTQLFFPPRTVSVNDIVAETLGAAMGVALWLAFGERLKAWLQGWLALRTPRSAAERLLYVYLFLLFGYNVLPLDLTISLAELYHKWREGKVHLLPFADIGGSAAEVVYALASDIAIWIPAAFLWKVGGRRQASRVVLMVLAWAAALEFFQLFVYSRVSSTTDILTALCGGALGATLGAWYERSLGVEVAPAAARPVPMGALLWLVAFVGWLGVMTAVFWYPFEFVTDWGFVHGRLAALKRAPLSAYYYGTELRAVTEVMHKTGFFFPLGALLGIATARIGRHGAVPQPLLHAASAMLVAGVAAGIELGQLFMPEKTADPADWILESAGALLGYLCARMLVPHGTGVRRGVRVRSPVG